MVCDRCIMVISERLAVLSLPFQRVELGKITLMEPPTPQQHIRLKHELQSLGFELLEDKKMSLISQIKSCVVRYVHVDEDVLRNKKLSAILSETLHTDYNYLSSLFSSIEGITLEKYVILQRIERAKELLAYNELSLSEIADKLSYSSVQHLSLQFKKITGLTPSQYKQAANELGRRPLDEIGS